MSRPCLTVLPDCRVSSLFGAVHLHVDHPVTRLRLTMADGQITLACIVGYRSNVCNITSNNLRQTSWSPGVQQSDTNRISCGRAIQFSVGYFPRFVCATEGSSVSRVCWLFFLLCKEFGPSFRPVFAQGG